MVDISEVSDTPGSVYAVTGPNSMHSPGVTETPEIGFELVVRDGRLVARSTCPNDPYAPFVVAWDMCAGCQQPLDRCTHDIPVEPHYITRWRMGLETSVAGYISGNSSAKISGGSVSAGKPKVSTVNVLDFVDDALIASVREAKDDNAVLAMDDPEECVTCHKVYDQAKGGCPDCG